MPFISKDLEQFSKFIIRKAIAKQIPAAEPQENLVERLRQAALKLRGGR